jgi:hypothetical protein
MLDGKTGKPRTIIDIEKAAKLSVKEGPNGPRFHKVTWFEMCLRKIRPRVPTQATARRGRVWYWEAAA